MTQRVAMTIEDWWRRSRWPRSGWHNHVV